MVMHSIIIQASCRIFSHTSLKCDWSLNNVINTLYDVWRSGSRQSGPSTGEQYAADSQTTSLFQMIFKTHLLKIAFNMVMNIVFFYYIHWLNSSQVDPVSCSPWGSCCPCWVTTAVMVHCCLCGVWSSS